MAGKNHKEGKVAGKNHRKPLQPKPDPKKLMEKVKFLGGLSGETKAVQAELLGEMDEKLLKLRSDPSPRNLLALQLNEHQLEKVNMLVKLMKDEVDDLAAEIIESG